MKLIKFLFSLVVTIYRLIAGLIYRFLECASQILPETATGCLLRGLIYKPFLKSCGKNFQVGISVKLEHLSNITVGNNVYIGHGCWISGLRGGVTLEDEVMLGPFVKMVSSNHTKLNGSYRFGPGVGKSIKIERGTWVASSCVVTAGTCIGEGSVIAAGSVVTKSFPSNSKLAGIPARVLTKIN
jgi:acetyltransferase-like isoleucine patch superfamily enzyme